MHRTKDIVPTGECDADIAMSTAIIAQYAYERELDEDTFTLTKAEAKAREHRLAVGARDAMLETYDKQIAVADLFYSAMCSIEQQMTSERNAETLTDDKSERYLSMLATAAKAYVTHSAAAIRTISQADKMKKQPKQDEWADMMKKGARIDSTATSPDADE